MKFNFLVKVGCCFSFVLALWSVSVCAETGEVMDWEADNCPAGLPADKNPYFENMADNVAADISNIKNGKSEVYTDDGIFDILSAKSNRYSQCSFAIRTRLDIPIDAFDSYNIYVERGELAAAERLFSMDKILEDLESIEDPNGPIYPIVRELYERAYSQEVSDMASANPQETKDMLISEFFCDCLETPVEEFE
ncbi:hypothetical protein ACQKFL_16800 [Vreelandella titanicae]|uniref:hypothetical protein n=1 Tax=Vreelandella titanicae TaxID=664683 RepID=UPI003CFFF1CB|tara:strand:+ start:1231 stop:1812 length:582 start_codon:yes stop_codon:yes gene_type:complete